MGKYYTDEQIYNSPIVDYWGNEYYINTRQYKERTRNIMKNSETTTAENKIEYHVTDIVKKIELDNGCIFNMKVNGVSINSCKLFEYTKDGIEDCIISFPGVKDKNGKKKVINNKEYDVYYDSVWFPISKELRTYIYNILKTLPVSKNS